MSPSYLFYNASSLEHYEADILALRCFDDRFRDTWERFLEFQNIRHRDPESPAGGAKIFFEPEQESDREYMCREIETSIRLHHTKKAWLSTHYDCGACGGNVRFKSDEDQLSYHANGHKVAREFLHERFPDLEVRTFFVDQNGVIETTSP